MLPTLVIPDPTPQSGVGGFLVPSVECGVHVKAACVGFIAILSKDKLPGHLCHVLGVYTRIAQTRADFQFFLFCINGFLFCDEAVLLHALNDVQLTRPSTFRIVDGVVS